MSFLARYYSKTPEEKRASSAIAFLAGLDHLSEHCPLVSEKVVRELQDQRSHLKLIASENYSSLAVQLAMGNLLTDKYAEGIPFRRFYAGCDNVDAIEFAAAEEAKALFGADHAYVQPHSGADANLVAFWAMLVYRVQNKEMERLGKKTLDALSVEEYEEVRQHLVNQKIMGMSLNSGGHLTHGYRQNLSSKMMRSVPYDVDVKTGRIDYEALKIQAQAERPMVLIAGYSAYPRLINFAILREIADSAGALLMVDMAHFAGLVAGKAMQGDYDPIPHAHIVTTTTHKTLRGPRGGMILCCKELKECVDKGCPLALGGPLPHVIAAKLVAFKEAHRPEFRTYARQITANAQALAQRLIQRGVHVTTGGTDNHLMVFDVAASFNLTGRQAEQALTAAGLTVNRNSVPFDKNGPWHTSGVRIGTAAVTTLGMKEQQMDEIGDLIAHLLQHTKATQTAVEVAPELLAESKQRVGALLKTFPLYPELMID